MATEAEKKLEGAEHREDRKDSEEMPVWAADMMKKMDSMHERMDAMEKGGMEMDRKDRRDAEDCAMDKKDSEAEAKEEDRQAEELERLAKEERAEGRREKADRKDRKDESEETAHKAAEELEARKKEEDRKGAMHREDKEREDKARADASLARQNRELQGRLEAMEAKVLGLYKEPSFEDRNALAEVRARADSVYQAATGRPASEPLPGEAPIAYRKRMADGLRKFSAKFKDERVDSLSGSAFDIVEQQIYADAQVAAKKPENLPPGQLRKITRNDSGHQITEYTGDPKAAWRNFSAGAVLGIQLKDPAKRAA